MSAPTHETQLASPGPIANVEMAAAWDGPEGEHWTEHAARYEATGEGFRRTLLNAIPAVSRQTILDIGCGTGQSTRDAARVASAGEVVGTDLSSRMLGYARRVAVEEGLTNARFEQADAQVHPFPTATFDLAISSFGSMFFADPQAAFTNIGRALRPGGRVALLAWRDLLSNEWVAAIRDALSLGRDLPLPPAGAPGPFAFSEQDHVARILDGAGFGAVTFTEVTEPIRLGDDTDDAYAFVSTFGITRGLTHDLDDEQKRQALDALRSTLAAHETPSGVLFGGSAWLIEARWGLT